MLLGMSRGHSRAFLLVAGGGCGKTGTGHKRHARGSQVPRQARPIRAGPFHPRPGRLCRTQPSIPTASRCPLPLPGTTRPRAGPRCRRAPRRPSRRGGVNATSHGARSTYDCHVIPSFSRWSGMALPPRCGMVGRPVTAGRSAARQPQHHQLGRGRRVALHGQAGRIYRSDSRRASTRSSMIRKSPTFSVRRGTPSTWAVAAMARSIWRRLGLPPRRATAAAS